MAAAVWIAPHGPIGGATPADLKCGMLGSPGRSRDPTDMRPIDAECLKELAHPVAHSLIRRPARKNAMDECRPPDRPQASCLPRFAFAFAGRCAWRAAWTGPAQGDMLDTAHRSNRRHTRREGGTSHRRQCQWTPGRGKLAPVPFSHGGHGARDFGARGRYSPVAPVADGMGRWVVQPARWPLGRGRVREAGRRA